MSSDCMDSAHLSALERGRKRKEWVRAGQKLLPLWVLRDCALRRDKGIVAGSVSDIQG